jgi:ABC-type nitrate/sulfonate/bicarbonate transport system permease component
MKHLPFRSAFIGVVVLVVAWWLMSLAATEYTLPSPLATANELFGDPRSYGANGLTTLFEALAGLLIAVIASGAVTIVIGLKPRTETLFYPTLVMFKAAPAVAFIPLIVTLVGTGFLSRALVAGMLSFFPLVIGGIDGAKGAPERLCTLARSYGSTQRRLFTGLTGFYCLHGFLIGLKTAAPLSVVGAIVGEYVAGGTPRGIGTSMMTSYATPHMVGVFACVLVATAIGLLFFSSSWMAWRLVDGHLHLTK